MCQFLQIARSTYYNESSPKSHCCANENLIISIFRKSRNNYGTRKIKIELAKKGLQLSRRKIGKIMKKYALVSKYTVKHFKVHKTTCNEEKTANLVARKFDQRPLLEVVVSDLTYVNVNGKWQYICILLDIFNREIIGYAAGKNKDATLVYKAFSTVKSNLAEIAIFHTDRGNEFKNKLIDELLSTFNIQRSLSKKGCPYDNAVAEATFKIIKTEFVFNETFSDLATLEYQLFDYVNWFNNDRIHGSLGYLSPVDYKHMMSA